MIEVILVINAGSSSIKFSLYKVSNLEVVYQGKIDCITEQPQFIVHNINTCKTIRDTLPVSGHESALGYFFDWLANLDEPMTLKAAGHRVVHGGTYFYAPTLITDDSLTTMASFIPLAPLHQSFNLNAINVIRDRYPDLPQVACFDTAFHQTQEKLATLFAIPRALTEEGVIRYGFHGISYEYIASVLPDYLLENMDGKVIVAHLGHGASMCAMSERKSIATSMGFTALDGLMMGMRCGSIDPGVLLYLLDEKKYTLSKLNQLLYKQSGLLGVSGISSDMRYLQQNDDPKAIEAVDLFCYRAARELGALAAVLQGCDAIVFTAGIGEHSAVVRKKIAEHFHWLGVVLDEQANQCHANVISAAESRVKVLVIPTNEEYVIAKHTKNVVLDKARVNN